MKKDSWKPTCLSPELLEGAPRRCVLLCRTLVDVDPAEKAEEPTCPQASMTSGWQTDAGGVGTPASPQTPAPGLEKRKFNKDSSTSIAMSAIEKLAMWFSPKRKLAPSMWSTDLCDLLPKSSVARALPLCNARSWSHCFLVWLWHHPS